MHIIDLIESDRAENPTIPESSNKFLKSGQQTYSTSSGDFAGLLAAMKKNVSHIDATKSTREEVLEKIKAILKYLESNSKWNEALVKGLELNVFQAILEQTLPGLDKRKFLFSKLSDFLPGIFCNTNFRLFKSDEINSAPKIGLIDKTKLHGYKPVQNIPIPPTHSLQGYKNALSVSGITLPFEEGINRVLELIQSNEINLQSRDEIQSLISELGFDTKLSINIFHALKSLDILIDAESDNAGNKLFSRNENLLPNLKEYTNNRIKEKIESNIGEPTKQDILNTLLLINE